MTYLSIPIERLREIVCVSDEGLLSCVVSGQPLKLYEAGWYHVVRIENQRLAAHRVAYALFHGKWPEGVVDHIDGNRKNNSRVNLRECTPAQNAMNVRRTRTTGAPQGTYGDNGRFFARTQHKGVLYRKGPYSTLGEAHAAYAALCNELRGEFSPFWNATA